MGVLALCRMDQVAWKFVRLVAVLVLALIALVLASYALHAGWQRGAWANVAAGASGACALAGFGVLTLAPLAPHYGSMVRTVAALGGLAGVISGWAWGFDQGIWPVEAGSGAVLMATLTSQVLAALLTGAVMLATVLGHAYLTQTSMTIRPLRRLARILVVAVGVRFVWALGVGGGLCWHRLGSGLLSADLLREQSLILIVRGVVGLCIPAVFAFMVLATTRLRATQSATGILYFTLVLIAIGELASLYLVRAIGVPF